VDGSRMKVFEGVEPRRCRPGNALDRWNGQTISFKLSWDMIATAFLREN
jgi:hypothetical protein